MVAICDPLGLFGWGDLEGEIKRETVEVAFDLLVEALRSNAIDGCQIDVEDHLLTTKRDDGGIEVKGCALEGRLFHG